MGFTRDDVRRIRTLIDAALQQLAGIPDVELSVGNATFGESNITFKLNVTAKGSGGKEADTFKLYASRLGLKANDLGAAFAHAGQVWTLVGYNPRARVAPLIVANSTGKKYKLQASAEALAAIRNARKPAGLK